MKVELVEDGIKITLDAEEHNVVRTYSEHILSQVEMQVKMAIRTAIAVATLGEDRMREILEKWGLLDGNADLSLSEMGALVEEVVGRDAIDRIISSSTKNEEGEETGKKER